jgi:excisionase family DNA binding protein
LPKRSEMPVDDDGNNDTQQTTGRVIHHLDELLTVDEVAALLKVSRSWVYERTRARHSQASERLPHIKIGKYVRFDRRALRTFLEQCRTT